MPSFDFEELSDAPLLRDAIYEGGPTQDFKYDPIPVLMKGSNVAGFRKKKHYAVLYTSGVEPNWPDNIDVASRTFTYHGDRRNADGDLHSTPGNKFLETQYQLYTSAQREQLLPTFIFRKANSRTPRAVQFIGLAAFGSSYVTASEVLSTYWCKVDDKQFLNYRVVYTILAEMFISRAWINDLLNGFLLTPNTPPLYRNFVETGMYG